MSEKKVAISGTAQPPAQYAPCVYTAAHFDAWRARISGTFLSETAHGTEPVFDVLQDTGERARLWRTYKRLYPAGAVRQHHNCQACRRFVQRYGGLVTVKPDGRVCSAVWPVDEDHNPYMQISAGMRSAVSKLIKRGQLTPFATRETVLGDVDDIGWTHFVLSIPENMRHKGPLEPHEVVAQKQQDMATVRRALINYPASRLRDLHTILQIAGGRCAKLLPQIQWLFGLHELHDRQTRERVYGSPRVIRAIMLAPAGFCHPNSSAVGTLMDMLKDGASHRAIVDRAQQLLDPGTYQRPQAAPKAGTIDAAEKLVLKMGIERSLERRHATLSDVPNRAIRWGALPQTPAPAKGVFAALRTTSVPKLSDPTLLPKTMSWARFVRDVLSTAERVEALVPARGPFFSLMTAAHRDAPPILKWDNEGARNPVSWYVYNMGSTASSFNLTVNQWVEVDYVLRRPDQWWVAPQLDTSGAIMFVLHGARDTYHPGLALFPEIIKSELHGVRSVIEAYSNRNRLPVAPKAQVAGLMFDKNLETWGLQLLVTTGGVRVHVALDRAE